MGNSGSINNISADDITAHQYRQRLREANLDHLPMHWQKSYIKEPQPQPQPHIKVLPELNEGPRLRTTTNGAILHSGGTISCRRESAPPPLLQRSRTSLNIDLSRGRDHSTPNRMQAHLSSLPDPNGHKSSYKRFGSEPDLRNSGDEDARPAPVPNPSRMSKSKQMVKSKKKNPAPAPPVSASKQQPTRDHNANRFGWQPPSQNPNALSKDAPQKKLRLFKTKAESKRSSSQSKFAAESSDSHFTSQTVEKAKEAPVKSSIQTSRIESKINRQPEPPSWKDNKVQVLPGPLYRREKSFDITLLTNRHVGTDEAIRNARERLKSTNQKKPADDIRVNTRQKSLEPEKPGQKSLLDVKLKTRKTNQQQQTTTTFDFRKELEEATKRRSMAVETLEKQMANKEVTSSDSGVGERPIPKARVNRTKRQQTDGQKKDKLASKPTAPSPKKISEVNKSQEMKKEKTPVRDKEPVIISSELKKRADSKIPQLTKTFYFGMENTAPRESPERSEMENFGKIQMEVIDQFAKTLMTNQRFHRTSSESSESALSSEEGCPIAGTSGMYDDTNTGGIQLHVRPTLPRRQLEIPRFSPAAAWRMLNDEQKEILLTNKATANAFINEFTEHSTQPIEERIQRVYREPVPVFQDNKSGDSGISGDAGLPDRGDSPRRLSQDHVAELRDKVGPFLTPWTPQQDLEEETSSDGEMQKADDVNKYPSRAHVFSLSLPRESHLAVCEEKVEDKPGFSSLQKLKRTVSGAFSNTPDRMDSSYRSDNWLLSRSAPNSIESSQVSPASPQGLVQDNKEILDRPINIIQPSSFSYLTGGKHVMYLPHHPIGESNDFSESEKPDIQTDSSINNSKENKKKYTSHKKQRENLQDTPPEAPSKQSDNNKGKGHRFTFQSTVRQIERRRIAEKLSKEAEQKEVQRLSELEAMRRVEEEFQRKRAREKASIRHQLRLFSMEESQCISLPVDWQANHQHQRADPDGAVASPTPSPTSAEDKIKTFYDEIDCMNTKTPYVSRIVEDSSVNNNGIVSHTPKTEILSEFQSSRRNYMDFRSDKKMDYHSRQMEHPAIVCQIPPKLDQETYLFNEEMGTNAPHNIMADSYQNGYRGRSLCSSDSDMSSPSAGRIIERKSQFRSRSPSPSL